MNTDLTITKKIEIKTIKHTFTDVEKQELGRDLAIAFSDKANTDAEFESVKKEYKSKEATADALIGTLVTRLNNGFEMVPSRCILTYDLKNRKKLYFLEKDAAMAGGGLDDPAYKPVHIEDMTAGDMQAELIEAESKFDSRDEIAIFPATEREAGAIIVGRLGNAWFSAVRIVIGKLTLEERLDSEQRSFKKRYDAISHAAKRAMKWLKSELKDQAQGFEDPIFKAVKEQEERIE